MADETNLYEVLRVSTNATYYDIRQAYSARSNSFRELHGNLPRTNSDQEQIDQLKQAYWVLSDPRRRETYDARNLKESWNSYSHRVKRAHDEGRDSEFTSGPLKESDYQRALDLRRIDRNSRNASYSEKYSRHLEWPIRVWLVEAAILLLSYAATGFTDVPFWDALWGTVIGALLFGIFFIPIGGGLSLLWYVGVSIIGIDFVGDSTVWPRHSEKLELAVFLVATIPPIAILAGMIFVVVEGSLIGRQ